MFISGNHSNVLTLPTKPILNDVSHVAPLLSSYFTVSSEIDLSHLNFRTLSFCHTLKFATGSGSSGWGLTGNAGTTPETNFLGTTDNQDLDIRTNNIIRTRITTKGQIETINTGKSVFLGESAGAVDDLSDNMNVFVGYEAGKLNVTGLLNL